MGIILSTSDFSYRETQIELYTGTRSWFDFSWFMDDFDTFVVYSSLFNEKSDFSNVKKSYRQVGKSHGNHDDILARKRQALRKLITYVKLI